MNNLFGGTPDNFILGLTFKQFLAVVIPIIVIQLSAIAAALINLKGQDAEALRGGKAVWAIILVVSLFQYPLGLLGPVLYFTIARGPYERD